MHRRHCLALGVTAVASFIAPSAWAGSYLNRAALMLDGAAAERDMVLPRSNDKELVRLVHAIARARADASRVMKVPRIVAGAHPPRARYIGRLRPA